MVGTPVAAPARATSPSRAQPSTVPATIATAVATKDCPGATRNVAVTGMSRLIPRLAHNPSWSVKPSERGWSSTSVAGASIGRSAVTAIARSLRRHDPDRFRRSTAARRPLSPMRQAPVCGGVTVAPGNAHGQVRRSPGMSLLCPKCHNVMHQYERNGVMVDQCTECKGLFLDRGELEKLVKAENGWYGDRDDDGRGRRRPEPRYEAMYESRPRYEEPPGYEPGYDRR